MSADAVAAIARNVRFNGLDPVAQVVPQRDDATVAMLRHRASGEAPYDVIDLDPYGAPTMFLDAALSSVADGGLLCVTCTDLAVLAGSYGETCFAKWVVYIPPITPVPLTPSVLRVRYGSYSVRSHFCQEMALRIVLACLSQHAARHKRYIVPLMSCSIDFYNRVFVRVYTSPAEMKKTASKVSQLCVRLARARSRVTLRCS